MAAARPFRDRFALHVLLAWVAGCLVLAIITVERLRNGLPAGPDDTLRMVQVRDLLTGQGWFDAMQYRIDPPAGVPMHWSRLVDLPIAALIALLTPLLGAALAEYVALIAVPLMTFGALVATIAWLGQRVLDRPTALIACFIAVLAFPLAFQLSPMRIDHHGWQAVCFTIAVAALAARRPAMGGAIAGIACAAGLLISLELLPLAAAIGGVLLLRRLRSRADARLLSAFVQALAGGLVLIFLVTRSLTGASAFCDAIAPAHIMSVLVLAAGVTLADRFLARSRVADIVFLVATGALALIAFGTAAPQCLGSPFGSLDPLVREYWYSRVPEGMPVWKQTAVRVVPMLVHLALALAAVVTLWRRARGSARAWWSDYLLLFLATSMLGLLVWRSMAFAAVLCLLPLAWLVRRAFDTFVCSPSPGKRFVAAAGLLLIIQPDGPVLLAHTVMPGERSTADANNETCEVGTAFAALDKEPPGVIFAQLDLGPDILLHTRHAVVATGHHRANTAIADVIGTFLGSSEEARETFAERGIDYVAFCENLDEITIYRRAAPGGLAAQLVEDDVPDWLEPVALPDAGSLRVWRVRREP
ncbi:hypothetical protein [Pseudoblastomonas halimionae]|uniref:AcrB/AcrD/AcrF family protein n=1 Tax=Alteriqipengyuania halimionae TaxID=1926630 RepID=A0A6I4U706_9SPHN|nr:hypothetical protein [Alteriqipengyuania halimionae]MXP10653.1 hypothetical protein [Alteriqipengyuania halimionae]